MTDHYVNAEIEREIYKEWIASPGWEYLVEHLKIDRNDRCEICGSTKDLQAHHKSYLWIGLPGEIKSLQLLCRKCHAEIHNMEE